MQEKRGFTKLKKEKEFEVQLDKTLSSRLISHHYDMVAVPYCMANRKEEKREDRGRRRGKGEEPYQIKTEEKSEVLRDKTLTGRLIILTITTWCLYPITWLIEATKVIGGFDADILHAVFEGKKK
jgi:hypothetical protein